jgi:DNA-binding transcriptional LysR family regulator
MSAFALHLRQLRTFATTAATLNFTRTAESLHLAQSSVSEQIQTLEEQLGTPLFTRGRGRLALTEAGRSFLPYAQQILALAQEGRRAAAAAAGRALRPLSVGGLETLCRGLLPAVIAAFAEKRPDVSLRQSVGDTGSLSRQVAQGELDLALVYRLASQAPAEGGAQAVALLHDGLTVWLPPSHPLARQRELAWAALAGERLLVTPQGCVYRRLFDALSQGQVAPAGEFASLGLLRGLVAQGQGCAVVPSLLAAMPGEPVAAVPLRHDGEAARPVLVALCTAPHDELVAGFIGHLREQLPLHQPLHQPVTAVEVQHGAGHEAVAHHEAQALGDVARPAHAAHGQALGHRRQRGRGRVAGHVLPDR